MAMMDNGPIINPMTPKKYKPNHKPIKVGRGGKPIWSPMTLGSTVLRMINNAYSARKFFTFFIF